MSAILAWLNRAAGLVPPMVYAAVVAALGTWSISQAWRLDSARLELREAHASVARAKNVNDDNKHLIAGFVESNAACFAGRRADADKFTVARAQWGMQRIALNATALEVRTNEIEVYRDPTCSELARVDVSLACPDLARGLRERSDRLNKIRDRYERSAGTGVGAAQLVDASGEVRVPAGG